MKKVPILSGLELWQSNEGNQASLEVQRCQQALTNARTNLHAAHSTHAQMVKTLCSITRLTFAHDFDSRIKVLDPVQPFIHSPSNHQRIL